MIFCIPQDQDMLRWVHSLNQRDTRSSKDMLYIEGDKILLLFLALFIWNAYLQQIG